MPQSRVPKPTKKSPVPSQKLQLKGLLATAKLGLEGWEQCVAQTLKLDIELVLPELKADAIEHTINYAELSQHALNFISKSEFQLLETLARELHAELQNHFQLKALRICLSKPNILQSKATACVCVPSDEPNSD